ncbi:YqcC family protein [Azomonas macrocytogenes]|uniref:Uncharacterized protein YqcC (DUF446 family) n=1 Tax=Azomonas macrocytogenes TaxID=69962 RepID=A0A839T7R5_AZOMA|nr:YqcC family protein [Azomonas macrocytogenes]MBB3105128.1 uncharacterized protein YqcC (DUF446 family) [Azomonas macrocytogenes]
MDARVPEIAEQLLLIERELRVQQLWSNSQPTAEALSSQEPFCIDTLLFEEWLQWVFLPKMKFILENDVPLPLASGIRTMAETVYSGSLNELRNLLDVLERFDRLIQGET